MNSPSDYELEVRRKLQKQIGDLRESLLDLLSMVSASTDPTPATMGGPIRPPAEELRQRAREIEHRDRKIHRARAVLDGTKDDTDQ